MGTRITSDGKTVTTLEPEEISKLNRAFSRMPYGGMVAMTGKIETVDDLLGKLDNLADTLKHVAERNEAKDRELTRLQGLHRAVGELFREITREE